MLKFYFNGSPNPTKVALFLEESGLPFEPVAVDTRRGDQFKPEFLKVNPNSKVPAIDDDGVLVFDSNAILLYLAEKFGEFLPKSGPKRAETLSWLMWQVGAAPFLGGGFGHFFAYAPEKIEYAINRYSMEAKRQFDVLNRQLADHEFVAGDDYTIADIALWPWYGGIALGRNYPGAAEFLGTREYEHVMRWAKQIDARPAVKRGRIVNKLTGDESEQLHERHDASDFELRTEDKIKGVAADQSASVKDDAI